MYNENTTIHNKNRKMLKTVEIKIHIERQNTDPENVDVKQTCKIESTNEWAKKVEMT